MLPFINTQTLILHFIPLDYVYSLFMVGAYVCVCSSRQKPPPPIASRFSWLDDLQSSTDQPFCVDCKADAANWTYKSLYRGDVARLAP